MASIIDYIIMLHVQLFTFKRIPTTPVPHSSVLCEECEEFTALTVRYTLYMGTLIWYN